MTSRLAFAAVTAIVLAIVVVLVMKSWRGKPGESFSSSAFNPVTDAAILRPTPPAPSDSPALLAALDAGLTPSEYRLSRQRLDPELCPKAGEQVNKLAGRSPTDPAAINIVSRCLHFGNAAWYKCLLEAKTQDEGNRCNARLLRELE